MNALLCAWHGWFDAHRTQVACSGQFMAVSGLCRLLQQSALISIQLFAVQQPMASCMAWIRSTNPLFVAWQALPHDVLQALTGGQATTADL
jgi:hypothetical protein